MAQMAQMAQDTAPSGPHDVKPVVSKAVHTTVVHRAVRLQARSSYKKRPFYTEQHPTRNKLHKLQQRLARQQRVERQRRRARKSVHMDLA
jgi:hypothetical protein